MTWSDRPVPVSCVASLGDRVSRRVSVVVPPLARRVGRGSALLAGLLLSLPASAQSVVTFVYHHVATDTPALTSVTPERFAEQMRYLDAQGFTVMALADAVNALRDGEALPDRVAVLTFDDGYRSVLTNALPILEQRNWPFTVFVAPAYVDSGFGGYLTWDELRELARRGGSVGNHTATHAHLLRRAEGESDTDARARIREEIEQARTRIAQEIPAPAVLTAVAYPYGEYDALVTEVVRDMGLVGIGQQSGAWGRRSDWYALPRYPVATGYDDLEDFAVRANSLPLDLETDAPYRVLNPNPSGPVSFDASVPPDLARRDEIACYAGGQGRIDVTWLNENRIRVRTNAALRPGRTKVNCTVPSAGGRYHWFSKLWITRNEDGSWYAEP